ncbi:Methenyltetrahydrofolate cyclohydrolase / Methylenetetrahydrofolate dehydrogenase (NADP+), partial [hydrothermal vent metagenome]
MPAQIINGKQIAADLHEKIARRVQKRLAAGKKPPGLAVVLIGEDHASQIY